MKSPRVNVSIPLHAYESLKRFCHLNDCSMSSYLSELVVASAPVLDALSVNLAAANAIKQDVEILAASPFVGVAGQLESALENAMKVLAAHPAQTSPSVCAGDGAGSGGGASEQGKNHLTPLLLTGGLGKTKNDQHHASGLKNEQMPRMWLASSKQEVDA